MEFIESSDIADIMNFLLTIRANGGRPPPDQFLALVRDGSIRVTDISGY